MHKNIIVDTSCLIILTKINELNLLKLLYSKVIITKEFIDAEVDTPILVYAEDDKKAEQGIDG